MIHSLSFSDSKNAKLPRLYLLKCQHYSKIHPLFSYVCGMYCVQVALTLLETDSIETTISQLIEYLERVKKNLKVLDGEGGGSFQIRKAMCTVLDKKYKHLTSILQQTTDSGSINFGQIVELLLELALLYDVTRGLYPLEEFKDEQEKGKLSDIISDMEIEYRIHYCRTQSSTILSVIKLGQNIADYMDQLSLVPTSEDDNDEGAEGISKEAVNDMIKHVMSLPDEAFDEIDHQEEEHEGIADDDITDIEGDNTEEEEGEKVLKSNTSKLKLALQLPNVPKENELGIKSSLEDNDVKDTGTDDNMGARDSPLPSVNNHKVENNTNNKNIPRFQHKTPRDYTKEELSKLLEDGELLESAAKDAKYAVSALNYEDCDTALSKLEDAIRLIKEYQLRTSK